MHSGTECSIGRGRQGSSRRRSGHERRARPPGTSAGQAALGRGGRGCGRRRPGRRRGIPGQRRRLRVERVGRDRVPGAVLARRLAPGVHALPAPGLPAAVPLQRGDLGLPQGPGGGGAPRPGGRPVGLALRAAPRLGRDRRLDDPPAGGAAGPGREAVRSLRRHCPSARPPPGRRAGDGRLADPGERHRGQVAVRQRLARRPVHALRPAGDDRAQAGTWPGRARSGVRP
jgi:hypothetical protein